MFETAVLALLGAVLALQLYSQEKLQGIQMDQAALAQELSDLKAQVDKSKAEIVAKVQALEDALAAAGNTAPEVDAALADLKTSVQSVDDLNPDA